MGSAKKDKPRKSGSETTRQTLQPVETNSGSIPSRLDKLIHERVRLGIISALAANDSLSFSELKHLLKTSDGNISVHARKLEDAGYVECEKSFDGRKPLTEYRITENGVNALARYIDHMDALIRAVKGGS